MHQQKEEMDTLTERLEDLKERGYTMEFKFIHHGLCTVDHLEHCYNPNDIRIIEHYRFEGESDPGDMTVLYAVESNDGAKGVVIDAFGTYSNPKLGEFMQKVQEIAEKANGQ